MTEVVVTVREPGVLTSVQDPGRPGLAFYGVPRSGWLDPAAAGLANRLVGNPAGTALLECNLLAPELMLEGSCRMALTGADMHWQLEGEPTARGIPLDLEAGQRLRGGPAVRGARGYLAIAGSLRCDRIYGSAATDLSTGFGGIEGRRLRAGDRLVVDVSRAATPSPTASSPDKPPPLTDHNLIVEIRLWPGPEWAFLSEGARRRLANETYSVSPQSNRMGARLVGPRLQIARGGDIPTVPVVPGVVQLPPSGQPIVILQDGPTTGGYPRIAVIPESDLGRFNQLRPGQGFGFEVAEP